MRLLILAALPLVLAGCGDDESAGNPDADTVSVDVASPPDSASPDPAPADTSWTLRHDGIGPLRVGMTVEEAHAALGGDFAAPGPDAGVSESPEACQYARSGRFPQGVRVMLEGLRVVRVEADSTALATAEGARIGDAEARIQQLYPGRVTVQPHKYTDGKYLMVRAAAPSDTTHLLVFETDAAGVVQRIRGGQKPQVEYVEGCG